MPGTLTHDARIDPCSRVIMSVLLLSVMGILITCYQISAFVSNVKLSLGEAVP